MTAASGNNGYDWLPQWFDSQVAVRYCVSFAHVLRRIDFGISAAINNIETGE
jgi:hypothetical protein